MLLCATSFHAACAMLGDLMEEAAKCGLDVHESKTKILWNGQGTGTKCTQTTVQNRSFDVLGEQGSTMYLERSFSFKDTTDVEMRNRVSTAWTKLSIYRSELTSQFIERKLKLFWAVVEPTLLYGCCCCCCCCCCSWTMTRAREQLIQTTQRKMLRKILGCRRQVNGSETEN